MYLGEIPAEIGGGAGTGYSEDEVLEGIDKISKQLEIRNLWEGILEGGDRRLARQRRAEEAERGRNQLQIWFRENVLKYKIVVDTAKADDIRWDRDNAIFADVLLRADETGEDSELNPTSNGELSHMLTTRGPMNGIPIGPVSPTSRASSSSRTHRKSTLYPVHRAMLIRSDFFLAMFSSTFREAQPASHLHIVPIDCSPKALEVVLTYLYTEKCDFPLEIALDVLFAADLLMIEKLKLKAAVIISTLGNGTVPSKPPQSEPPVVEKDNDEEEEVINIYDVVRAGWLTRVPRLEEFAAKYFADRLESYIDEPEFAELIQESASKIKARQETDSIELLDE